jgi:amino acid transporter
MSTQVGERIGAGGVAKRLLVGPAVPTHKLEHTLLPKFLGLPVFCPDALSSVIYAPEEVMIVLLAASASAAYLGLPIAAAISTLMVIVVISYRQTIRAYPSGGGAYIVGKDNLGTIPGLVAAAALLIDYVMTVAVSIVAGVIAIASAVPALLPHKVALSLAFVAFITLVNLRGAKESGAFFAPPVYLFIASVLVMVGVGVVKCLSGTCPDASPQHLLPIPRIAAVAAPVGTWTILRAFSSGSAALTGVEAIANGVTAFRRPQAKNAATTLAIMAAIAICMFMGITFLATRAHITLSDHRSLVGQVSYAVFDGGFGFYVVQFFSAAILVLAANTSMQGFPRLSAIMARDRFMPQQFQNRGNRLVFSNGTIVLAAVACVLIYAFDADLTALIQLYVVGVFTAFTVSQAGMVRHWLKERYRGPEAARGWRRSIVINSVGAVTTFVVLAVVLTTKFTRGAWMVVVAVPLLVLAFLSVHRHYTSVRAQLRRGRVTVGGIGLNHVVLVVRDLDDAMVEALGYVRSIRPTDLRAVFPTADGVPVELQERWRRLAVGCPGLEPLPVEDGDLLTAVRAYVRGIPCRHRDFITVVVPEVIREEGVVSYLVRRRSLVRLKAGLLREPNVVVADVPVRVGEKVAVGAGGRPLIPQRTVALVFVSALHDATVRAVNYARALEASETRAIYFDLDPEQDYRIEVEWAEKGLGVPLDIVEAPFRDLTVPMLTEVRSYTERPDTLAVVIIPEFVVTKWRHMLLHNQSALFVKRLMLSEPRVVLASVPFGLEM